MTVVMWFRRDLRLNDNPALAAAGFAAAAMGAQVVPLFVLDPVLTSGLTGFRRDYFYAALAALDKQIRTEGDSRLLITQGNPRELVVQLAADLGATQVFITGDYSPYGTTRDRTVAARLAATGRQLQVVDSPYLHAPGAITKSDGQPYSVFTPYYRKWSARPTPEVESSVAIRFAADDGKSRIPAAVPNNSRNVAKELRDFLAAGLSKYGARRNRPDLAGTSRLGAALHFGQLHPRTILEQIQEHGAEGADFLRQLCWRDFYADILFHRPESARANVDKRFDSFPWRTEGTTDDFDAWSRGLTGFPFVDAGMRQLLDTGWMHNRSRMVTASFLTKDLLIDWRRGARWFLQHLTDADVANNSLGWQWAAGSGTDAAPFFRVFNPVLQGQRFDPNGDYVRRFVPELRHLEGSRAHQPWKHPEGHSHGYPPRMLDHDLARREALAAYEVIKNPN